ncbi:MAG: twin-arginine translocase TatA/TatE family subunit [Candidatus Altiarchaeota archaeon]
MIGTSELILVFIIALLFLNPKKLPEVARSLAKAIKEFRKAVGENESEKRANVKELKG